MLLTGIAILGLLLGVIKSLSEPRSVPNKLSFNSTGNLDFFFEQPLDIISPSKFFIKVKGIFFSDGLLFTIDNNDILIYISDLSKLNIKVKSKLGTFTNLNSPINLGTKITFTLELTNQEIILKFINKDETKSTITKKLSSPIDISSAKKFYLSGAPNVAVLGLNALNACYDYVWIESKVYTNQNF